MTKAQQELVPAVSDDAAIYSIIERAARDPSVDIDKMERLLQMRERVRAQTAQAAFTSALAEMQPKLPTIGRKGEILDKEGRVRNTYARWEDINDAIRPMLAEHGFSLSFRVGLASDGRPTVTGVLSHRDGHHEETTMVLPIDTHPSRNAIQSLGSSTSYGKRYVTLALLNITTRGEDDDGQAAASAPKITEEQRDQILGFIEDHGFNLAKFCRFMGVAAVADLPAKRFERAMRELNARAAQQ